MHWPLARQPIPISEIPFYNLHYLYGCPSPNDPTMTWGTVVSAEPLTTYVNERNKTGTTIVSAAHVLLQAVGRALNRHPEFNCRIVGRRIFDFRDVNLRMMMYNKAHREVEVLLIRNADTLSLERIARIVWKNQYRAAKGDTPERADKAWLRRWLPGPLLGWTVRSYLWLDSKFNLPKIDRIDRIANSPVLVNYLGFAGAPPMRTYQPSNYPHESSTLSVTMGRTEATPVDRDGDVVVGLTAPLFVRADHRIANAHLLAQFTETLRELLTDPASMDADDALGTPRQIRSEAA